MKQDTYFHRVQTQTPTRFWINNVTTLQARLALEAGAVGCTQNPSYTWKMLNDPVERKRALTILDEILESEQDGNEALVMLQQRLVGRIAKEFYPFYQQTCERNGYVSIQGDPLHEDTESIVRYARYNRKAGANIMAKIPVTEDGLEAIEILAAEGIPINATEVMSVRQAIDVCEAYERATKNMKDRPQIYFSHIAGIFDQHLKAQQDAGEIDVNPDALWQAGVIVAKKIYRMVQELDYQVGFISGGARGLHHFTEMVGAAASVTINWKGTAQVLIEQNPPVVQRFLQPSPESVIDHLLEKSEVFRKSYLHHAIEPEEYEEFGPVVLFRSMFEDAWKNALSFIEDYRQQK